MTYFGDLIRWVVKSWSHVLHACSGEETVHSSILSGYLADDGIEILGVLDINTTVVDTAIVSLRKTAFRRVVVFL